MAANRTPSVAAHVTKKKILERQHSQQMAFFSWKKFSSVTGMVVDV
jgi:hypothetical protein